MDGHCAIWVEENGTVITEGNPAYDPENPDIPANNLSAINAALAKALTDNCKHVKQCGGVVPVDGRIEMKSLAIWEGQGAQGTVIKAVGEADTHDKLYNHMIGWPATRDYGSQVHNIGLDGNHRCHYGFRLAQVSNGDFSHIHTNNFVASGLYLEQLSYYNDFYKVDDYNSRWLLRWYETQSAASPNNNRMWSCRKNLGEGFCLLESSTAVVGRWSFEKCLAEGFTGYAIEGKRVGPAGSPGNLANMLFDFFITDTNPTNQPNAKFARLGPGTENWKSRDQVLSGASAVVDEGVNNTGWT